MASLTIRNLDEGTKQRLRVAAASNGRSMEDEARRALTEKYPADEHPRNGLGTHIHNLFKSIGGVELELPERQEWRPPPDFSGPEYGGKPGWPRRRKR